MIEEKKTPVTFSINKIDLLRKGFAIQEVLAKDFEFQISLEVHFNAENKTATNIIHVEIQAKEQQEGALPLGFISVACTCIIQNFDEIAEVNDKNQIVFPQEVIDLLNTIVIGTTRGIMYQEFKGTFLDNAILPILNPQAFWKEKKQSPKK